MDITKWTEVDRYLENLFASPDPVLEAALHDAAQAGLPAIQITPIQGKLLGLLARAVRAQRILEIGTLGGYSTIWLARSLPEGGRLITLEVNPAHAEVARKNLDRAGLQDLVEVRLGSAVESMEKLMQAGERPFDFVFIDADKPGYPTYLRLALKMCRAGSLIVADNVIRKGAIVDSDSEDESVQAVQVFLAQLAAETDLMTTAIQMVGSKGYDGFTIALVVGDQTP